MKSTPSAPVAKPVPEKIATNIPAPAPSKAQERAPLAAPLTLPAPAPQSPPAVMTPVGATPIDLVSPSAKIDIDVTIIELANLQRAEQSLLTQSITAVDHGACPTCGEHHVSGAAPLGHATDGWFQMNEGIRCGVCSMTPDQIVARLQQNAQATVTATPHAQVLSRQVAEIGLTEKQGFRRINFRSTGEKDQYELLQGGVEMAMRPTLEANGVIELDLTPVTTTSGVPGLTGDSRATPSTTSLLIQPGSCAVIGGMYFGTGQDSDLTNRSKRIGSILTGKFENRDIREVVIVVRVQPARDSDMDASPASMTIETESDAPAPLLIPASASPIPQ